MHDMTCSYMWHDPFVCVAWFIHTSYMTPSYWEHDSIISTCTNTHSDSRDSAHALSGGYTNVWHDSFLRFTRLNRDMTQSYRHARTHTGTAETVHKPFQEDTQICDMTHSYGSHDSLTCAILLIPTSHSDTNSTIDSGMHSFKRTQKCVAWLSPLGDVNLSCVQRDSFICVTRLMQETGTCVLSHMHAHARTHTHAHARTYTHVLMFAGDTTQSYVRHDSVIKTGTRAF